MDLPRDGGNCDVAIAAPLKWPKTAIPPGIATALVGSWYGVATLPRLADLFAMAEFRVPGQMPPFENENEPIKYCHEPNSVPYPLQRNFVA
jgi:hypothetical protein